jgi:pimeloyl-ACP methyl ester carboxylesterase
MGHSGVNIQRILRAAFALGLLAISFCLPTTLHAPAPTLHAAANVATGPVVGGHLGTLPPLIVPDDDFHLTLPTHAATRGPLQVLVAIHGQNGNGVAFGASVMDTAAKNGWILVAPTFRYRNNVNPDSVLADDLSLLPRLKQYLDDLPSKTGLPIRPKVLLYGFSRGGQIAHRFAELYPQRTLAVALFAAGTYTLPVSTLDVGGTATTLDLPFGIADLRTYTGAPFDAAAFRAVPFFIGVGGADDHAGDAPPSWNVYDGATRLARAKDFASALRGMGVDASLTVFPGVGHAITPAMRDQALAFLARQAASSG